MHHLKQLQQQKQEEKEEIQDSVNEQQPQDNLDKHVLNQYPGKSPLLIKPGQNILINQVNYFTSPVINNVIKNCLSEIKPMTLQQDNNKAFCIGVCGGSSAGKSIIANLIMQSLKEFKLVVASLKQTDFYKNPPKNSKNDNLKEYNFDQPEAVDWKQMKQSLETLVQRKDIHIPQYDIDQQERKSETQLMKKADVIVVEGTLIYCQEEVRNFFDLKIFLDTDEDIRLSRRIYKEVCIRKKDLNDVVEKYLKFNKPGFEKYTLRSKQYADIIIPNYGEGFSNFYKDEIIAGFSTVENAALEIIINQAVSKKLEIQKNQQQQQ